MSVALHNLIDKVNFLPKVRDEINNFLRDHPNLYKVVLIANHFFRAIAITALTAWLPFSLPVNIAICAAGSLFYSLTMERGGHKLALPALAGSLTFKAGVAAFQQIVNGVAFASFETFATTFGTFVPLAAYAVYVILTVNYDVNHRL
jgi:hypothetical protein